MLYRKNGFDDVVYLRPARASKEGKIAYWQLVRSVRVGNKVRQETVAYLGKLDAKGRKRAQNLSQKLGGHEEPPGLFDQPIDRDIAEIRLKEVRLERTRRFGGVWLAMKLWRMAKLDDFFQDRLPPGGEDIPWRTMAQLLTIARLCEPSSELHIAEDWLRKTALADLLGIKEDKINEDRLYRGLDKILPLKKELEAHLKRQWEGLFGISYELLLYDVTSTYFEGQAKGNPQAQRGHSRDNRGDCKQVCIGLVVSREGHPLGYEVFTGNLHDSKTVQTIISSIESRYGKSGRVWVMDRGMVSQDILEWMRQGGRRYVVGMPKSELKKHKALLESSEGWTTLPNGVRVRYAERSDTQTEAYLLCQSDDRRQKESAIHALFLKRIEQALEKLTARIQKASKSIALEKVERQIGRLLQKNQRAAKLFDIQVKPTKDHPAGIQLDWKFNEDEQAWAERAEGCYILRTNVLDWTEEELWKTYIQLTRVEDAFRIHKSQLDIRPIWHQKEDRVQAHIFVCFLAYALWKLLEEWQSRAGLGNSPRTILEELGSIQSADAVLPTTAGEEIRLRCIVQPENTQKAILDRLGIALPKRMRMPEAIGKNVV